MKACSNAQTNRPSHGLPPLGVVALASVAMMLPGFVSGLPVAGFDAEGGIRAMFHLTAGLGPSQVLLPQMMGGYPYALDSAVSPSPLLWLWARVGYDQGFAWVVALHFFVAGWGVLRWLAGWGVRGAVATAAALAWMFCGQMTGHLVIDGYQVFFAVALLPHLFHQALAVARCPGRHSALAWGVCLAVALVDGHLAMVSMLVVAAVGVALLWAWVSQRPPGPVLAGLAAGGLVALPLSLPVVVGLATLAKQGPRQGSLGWTASLGGLPVESLFTLWLPGVWGRDAVGGGHLGRGFGSMNQLYVGVLWPLALLAQRRGWFSGERLVLALGAVGLGLLAIGLPSPLALAMQKSAFPLSLLRLPVRWVAPALFLALTLAAQAIVQWQVRADEGNLPVTLPRWVTGFAGVVFATGFGLGLLFYLAPAPTLLKLAQFLKRDPGRIGGLDAVSAYDWEMTGLWWLGETAAVLLATVGVLLLLRRGRLGAAIMASTALSLAAATADLWFTLGRGGPPIPAPAAVAKNDRLLSLVTHRPLKGKYLTMFELLSQGAVGKLLEQGYAPIQASMPLPHSGWQGLLSGHRTQTVETGVRLSPTLLRLLGVKWVVTRDRPHPRCLGVIGPKEKSLGFLRGDASVLAKNPPRPRGLAWDFLCLEKELLAAYGWEEEKKPSPTPGYRWWRNSRVLRGAYFLTGVKKTKDPYGELLKTPLSLLEKPPVDWDWRQEASRLAPAPGAKEPPMASASASVSPPAPLETPVRWQVLPPDRFTVSLSASAPGLVALTLPYYRHYRAVDAQGRPVAVRPVGGALVGLLVGKGPQRLTLFYDYPLWVLRGYALGFWALALGLLWWWRPGQGAAGVNGG